MKRAARTFVVSISLLLGLLPGLASASAAEPTPPPTPLQYFGLIAHRLDSGTPWPPFRFGTWRLWDAYVGWPDLEPSPGQWNFKRLDLYVFAAQAKGVEIIYPLGLSAPWASARPTEPSGYKPGYAAEPRDLTDWRNYVRTVAERYKGRIRYYEVWNEPSDKTYFSGNPDTLVQMLRIAYETLKQVDPAIQVIAPGVTGEGRHLVYLDDLLARGAGKYIDIVGHHFYVPRGAPEAMVPLMRQVRAIMRKHGMGNKPLWNTETGWWIGNTDGTPDHPMVAKGGWRRLEPTHQAGAFVVRALLLARAEGIDRFCWYSWDNLYGLGMRDPTTGNTKPMAKAYDMAVDWMLGRAVTGCEEMGGIYTCKLESETRKVRRVLWSPTGAIDWQVPSTWRVTKLQTLDGTLSNMPLSGTINLSEPPVMVE